MPWWKSTWSLFSEAHASTAIQGTPISRLALPFTFKAPIGRFFLLNPRDGAEVAFQKKKAITRVMAFSISVGF
jgi:hypothetical protein